MTLTDAIILGVIQGASEFLPISSSAHLVFGQALLGVQAPSIFLEVALHFGTLLSVLIYFRRDIARLVIGLVGYPLAAEKTKYEEGYRTSLYIILGTIPAVIGGFLLKDWFEARFDSAAFSGYMLLITAVVLLLTRLSVSRGHPVNAIRALAIGLAQFCAILPGISRSGSTIATGLFLGVTPKEAARFSFLLSLPAVAGAALLKLTELAGAQITAADMASFAVGAVVSAVVGITAIHYLLKLVTSRRFYIFGFYCLIVGGLAIIYL